MDKAEVVPIPNAPKPTIKVIIPPVAPLAFPSVPKEMLKATHKLKGTSTKSISWGTCVAIDLSSYGLPGKKYLLTAGHCVSPNISIEIVDTDGSKIWVDAKAIALDKNKDMAILLCERDLPVQAVLSDTTDLGDAVIAIGNPRGTMLSANIGFLADKGFKSSVGKTSWYQASCSVTHGNSGGPVFDANNGTIIGIVTAVIADVDGNGNMINEAPNITMLVGARDIDSFILVNFDKISTNKTMKIDDEDLSTRIEIRSDKKHR